MSPVFDIVAEISKTENYRPGRRTFILLAFFLFCLSADPLTAVSGRIDWNLWNYLTETNIV